MRSSASCLLAVLTTAMALRPASKLATSPAVTRRTALAALPLLVSASALADEPREGGALSATCLGFGCNPYGDIGFNGLSKENAPPGSLPYPDFLKALKAKEVERVIFEPPSGDEAYAVIGGKKVRIGEGWPVELSNSWSSPTWVVRILENERVPYTWNFDLKTGTSKQAVPPSSNGRVLAYESLKDALNKGRVEGVVFSPGAQGGFALIDDETYKFSLDATWKRAELAKVLERRDVPNNLLDVGGLDAIKPQIYQASRGAVSALDASTKTGGSFSAQPKMYGGADTAMDIEAVDYTGNLK